MKTHWTIGEIVTATLGISSNQRSTLAPAPESASVRRVPSPTAFDLDFDSEPMWDGHSCPSSFTLELLRLWVPRPRPCVFCRDRAGILILTHQLRRSAEQLSFPRRPLATGFPPRPRLRRHSDKSCSTATARGSAPILWSLDCDGCSAVSRCVLLPSRR